MREGKDRGNEVAYSPRELGKDGKKEPEYALTNRKHISD
jgi:hypothetical protein